MAWEVDKLHRTLLIEKYTESGKTYYAIYPFSRVVTETGTSYLEPLPHDTMFGIKRLFKFNSLEFIGPPTVSRDNTWGDLGLTNSREEGVRRGA